MAKEQEIVLRIPYGTRDFLPWEAALKRELETSLAAVFIRWGYEEVVTPTLEYLETLAIGTGDDIQGKLFNFFDKNNRIVALRYDMTTPLARLAASRLQESPFPLKLSYITNVYRYEQAQTGRQCEFYQAGVELMGTPGPAADAEVIALAVECIRDAGLEKFQISLGQAGFINGAMEESGLTPAERQNVKRAMVNKDLVGLAAMLERSDLPPVTRKLLNEIPILHGGKEVLRRAGAMASGSESRRALDNLAEIYRILELYGVEQYVNFDLGVIRDLDYYTGMVFEAYTPGLGFPVCGGGRYDNMLTAFGAACPATGFALGIERIMLALERQGVQCVARNKQVYVGWAEGKLAEAIKRAGTLRQDGRTAELALSAQTREEAAASQAAKGFRRLLYVE